MRIALRDDETETWAEIEIGTGQVDDLVRLLQEAFADADDAQMRPDGDGEKFSPVGGHSRTLAQAS